MHVIKRTETFLPKLYTLASVVSQVNFYQSTRSLIFPSTFDLAGKFFFLL